MSSRPMLSASRPGTAHLGITLLGTALLGAMLTGVAPAASARAATIAPPMYDVSRQCNAMARRNTTMMSECIVAESEARADLLQHWNRLPDASVERCLKLGAKLKRQPYVALEKCLSPDLSAAAAPPAEKR